jgi:hypothetical protein
MSVRDNLPGKAKQLFFVAPPSAINDAGFVPGPDAFSMFQSYVRLGNNLLHHPLPMVTSEGLYLKRLMVADSFLYASKIGGQIDPGVLDPLGQLDFHHSLALTALWAAVWDPRPEFRLREALQAHASLQEVNRLLVTLEQEVANQHLPHVIETAQKVQNVWQQAQAAVAVH